MNAELLPPTSDPLTTTPHLICRERHFSLLLSATRRGARLARHLAAQQLATWGWPYDTRVCRTAAHLVAELAANAVLHGHVPGRDFRLTLAVSDDGRVLRIEVTDARIERLPLPPAPEPPPAAELPSEAGPPPAEGPPPTSGHAGPHGDPAEGGRGLLLLAALADRWGTLREPPCTKTVWCELALPGDMPTHR